MSEVPLYRVDGGKVTWSHLTGISLLARRIYLMLTSQENLPEVNWRVLSRARPGIWLKALAVRDS